MNLDQTVNIKGYIKTVRNHGHLQFLDVIYANEEIQIVNSNPIQITRGTAVSIIGKLCKRAEEQINPNKINGALEIICEKIEILNHVANTMPFNCYDENIIAKLGDEQKHKHRALYLRSKYMQNNIRIRAEILQFCRNFMNKHDYIEIQTPILTACTPEGARDFVIPSRLHAGKFYALPQSPQQFKQSLMAAGFEKYYSIAPCFRDENGRRDRAYGEFYQLDIECSFATANDIINLLCEFTTECLRTFAPDKSITTHVMTYDEALHLYGSDKPDLRILNQLISAPDYITSLRIMSSMECVKALRVNISYEQVNKIYDLRDANSVRFEYLYNDNGILKGKLSKFITNHDIQDGEAIFFAGGSTHTVNQALSFIRNNIVKIQQNVTDFAIVIVKQFPMFEKDDSGNPTFCHNPFSKVVSDSENIYDIKAEQYDLVLNGYELASGSERNTDTQKLLEYFEMCGYNRQEVLHDFNLMFESFAYGIVPHAGMALGIERLLMIILNIENLRDVVAFPLPNSGIDPLTNTPKQLSEEVLNELHIKLIN